MLYSGRISSHSMRNTQLEHHRPEQLHAGKEQKESNEFFEGERALSNSCGQLGHMEAKMLMSRPGGKSG